MRVKDAPREITSRTFRGKYDFIQCTDGRVKYQLKKQLPGSIFVYVQICKRKKK